MDTRSTWDARELQILFEVHRAEEEGRRCSLRDLLNSLVSIPSPGVHLGLRSLHEASYISGNILSAWNGKAPAGVEDMRNIRLQERGRRAIHQWPSDAPYERLLQIVDHRLAEEIDPEQRSRLVKLREFVVGAGKDVFVSVLAEVARHAAGLP
jgi:hypothetical protein